MEIMHQKMLRKWENILPVYSFQRKSYWNAFQNFDLV